MFATVIPLTKIPLHKLQAYTYNCTKLADDIRIGQQVVVPLYRRTVTGIVTGLQETAPPDIAYKPVERIADPLPFASERDIALVRFAAGYYYAPLGIVCKHALPALPKRSMKKIDEALARIDTGVITEQTDTAQLSSAADITLAVGTPGQRHAHYAELIISCLDVKRQVLLLVPELALIPQTLSWLKQCFPREEVVLLHGSISKSDQLIGWRKAQTGSATIFVGTRSAVFTSFHHLGHIIIDEEQDSSYKQWDMAPRFDARTVCKRKAALYGCPLTYGTAAPSVAAYAKLKDKSYRLKALNTSKTAVPTTIVDMRRELAQGNYSLFSETLLDALTTTLAAGKQAIIYVNRRGTFRFLMCRDCGYIPRCPDCTVALVEHGAKQLACSHCSFRAGSPALCPQCSSTRIKGFGSGVERVQEELSKKFPDKTVSRFDVGATTRLSNISERYREFVDKKIDILVGTAGSIRLQAPALDFIAAINIDVALNFPDWRTDERAWSIVKQLSARDDVRGCLIQTYNPGHFVLQNKKNFYEQQLAGRKRFGYPPFVTLIKLTCKGDDLHFVATESERVADELIKVLPAPSVVGPTEPINPKIRGLWQKIVIVKLDLQRRAGLTKSKKGDIIDITLKNLSNSWSIDVDPLT